MLRLYACSLLFAGLLACTPTHVREVLTPPVRASGLASDYDVARTNTWRIPRGACVRVATPADPVGHAFERQDLAVQLARLLSRTHQAFAIEEPASRSVAMADAAAAGCAFLLYPRLEAVAAAGLTERARKHLTVNVYDVHAATHIDSIAVAVTAPLGLPLVRPTDVDVALAVVANALSGND